MALIKYRVNGEWVNGGVATVNSQKPDENGNVNISGLPDVDDSGKALVSVNGEWTKQEGYGYSTELYYSQVEESGAILRAVRVSDIPEDITDDFGDGSQITVWTSSGGEQTVTNQTMVDMGNGLLVSDNELVIFAFNDTEFPVLPDPLIQGVYFMWREQGGAQMYSSGFAFGHDATTKDISWNGELGQKTKIDPDYLYTIGTGLKLENGVLSLDIESLQAMLQ